MYVVDFLRADDELENDLLGEFYEDCRPPAEGAALKDMSDISFEAWACFDAMTSDLLGRRRAQLDPRGDAA